MSTTIYLIRHGESEANERNIFLGHGDLALTGIGQKQACMAADYLKTRIGQPDAIYSSDLKRACETGKATADRFDMPITKDQSLREIDAGEWDFVPYSELERKYPDTYKLWVEAIGNSRCDGGESVQALQSRIVSAITRIAKHHENSTVFIFTHATPIRVFAAHCLKKSLGEIKDIPWVTNASITKAVFDEGYFRLLEYGYDDFMGELITVLPANV